MWKPLTTPQILPLPQPFGNDCSAAWMPTRVLDPTVPIPDISDVPLTVLQEVATFKVAKRAEEHASGRWLVAHLLRLWGIEPDGLEVVRDDYRKPMFADGALPSFSISHSGGIVAALIAPPSSNVGIDCEPRTERKQNLAPFLTAGEERAALEELWLTNPQEASVLTNRLWVVKEAVLKAVGKGMGIPPQSLTVIGSTHVECEGESIQFIDWSTVLGDSLVDLALARKCENTP